MLYIQGKTPVERIFIVLRRSFYDHVIYKTKIRMELLEQYGCNNMGDFILKNKRIK